MPPLAVLSWVYGYEDPDGFWEILEDPGPLLCIKGYDDSHKPLGEFVVGVLQTHVAHGDEAGASLRVKLLAVEDPYLYYWFNKEYAEKNFLDLPVHLCDGQGKGQGV